MLDWSTLEAFADNKINVAEIIFSNSARVENIVGKGDNAGCQHFFLFPQCFQKSSFTGLLKIWIVWKKVKATVDLEEQGLSVTLRSNRIKLFRPSE